MIINWSHPPPGIASDIFTIFDPSHGFQIRQCQIRERRLGLRLKIIENHAGTQNQC